MMDSLDIAQLQTDALLAEQAALDNSGNAKRSIGNKIAGVAFGVASFLGVGGATMATAELLQTPATVEAGNLVPCNEGDPGAIPKEKYGFVIDPATGEYYKDESGNPILLLVGTEYWCPETPPPPPSTIAVTAPPTNPPVVVSTKPTSPKPTTPLPPAPTVAPTVAATTSTSTTTSSTVPATPAPTEATSTTAAEVIVVNDTVVEDSAPNDTEVANTTLDTVAIQESSSNGVEVPIGWISLGIGGATIAVLLKLRANRRNSGQPQAPVS